MASATWGSTTAKAAGGGSSDPNVLSLKEANRIRLLEPGASKWRQHFITSATDPEQGRSVVCPKGPDGRDQASCPLCMKPVGKDGKQRFPISRRFATNVWDYESNSVKVLIAGPQVFEEFDAIAAVGIDPTSADFLIHKMGTGINTSYKVVRADATPLAVQITPDMLHDIGKYDTPTSTEKIFELLEEMGIDYDALELPSFTLEEAESFQMPYGKMKGMTIEQIVAQDTDYALYMHRMKKEQGSFGDPVFIALQVVLEANNEVEALEEITTAPPRPAPAASVPPVASPGPSPATESTNGASGMVTLIGPDGSTIEIPAGAAPALLAAGYTEPQPEPVQDTEPSDDTEVQVDISGTKATMRWADAKSLVASGIAKLIGYGQSFTAEPEPEPEPEFQLPGDDDQVEIKLAAIPAPVPVAFKDAKGIVARGQGEFTDPILAAAVKLDREDDKNVAAEVAAAASQPDPPEALNLDPSLTVKDSDGKWTHPALDKSYASKGGVTQALNRLKKDAPEGEASTLAVAAEGVEGKREIAKNLMRDMPEITSDFKKLLNLFEEVAGKRQITDFDEPELDALIVKLQEMQTA